MTEPPEHLRQLRRELHRHPEPGWREFYTTARILEAIERIGVDDIFVGSDALASDARIGIPDDEELARWRERASEAGVAKATLEQLDGGHTGAIAVLRRGEGPTVGLRVDIDALPRRESTAPDHRPVAEGFRPDHDDAMHACGHDAHATIGVGVLEAIGDSDFEGTLKVIFQPAEEVIGGGRAIAESGHLDDVDALLAIHIGLDHPTGEVVAGIEGMFAVANFRAEFAGASAHAGGHPDHGANAVQAMTTAVQNLYAIPRHTDGATRVNAGSVGGGSASNVIPESAYIEGEVRGGTTDLREYMRERAETVIQSAAEMHDCEVSVEWGAQAPSADPDPELRRLVYDVAGGVDGVDSRLERAQLGGSEDATFLMRRVQEAGGQATFVGIGTDHPGGHHTATFDVDETSIGIGVDVLTEAILAISEQEF
ncbi:amidohydrolase protein [Halorhabdus tiamatea SARL4B]|uniref:Amidohydrolase protein n=1 Tax=Halorhabdus tiamatea SARL4B TaxID=1033806 RepID=F7PMB6_9EURY|nr:amidohydrolase [Halorhabdus tiamatea]ERJ05530.1 amidohydrolase protein [Halorhabdus tiamatea SARL4B]CCQ32882.1 N-acyl-L-amino acid amidohydrolase [Halorhabdus tiamatea SARL4B]